MSDAQSKIKIFESQQIRTEWDAEAEKWWFSVLDVIAVLTEQPDYKKVRNYWKWLKNKLIAEGSQLVSATHQLKMKAADGKYYKADVVDTEQNLRLIQSLPSKKADVVVHVGSERLDQLADSERLSKRCAMTRIWGTRISGSTSDSRALNLVMSSPMRGRNTVCTKGPSCLSDRCD